MLKSISIAVIVLFAITTVVFVLNQPKALTDAEIRDWFTQVTTIKIPSNAELIGYYRTYPVETTFSMAGAGLSDGMVLMQYKISPDFSTSLLNTTVWNKTWESNVNLEQIFRSKDISYLCTQGFNLPNDALVIYASDKKDEPLNFERKLAHGKALLMELTVNKLTLLAWDD